MSTLARIRRVDHLGGLALRVSFDDGLVRDLDLDEMLHGGVLDALRDTTLFARVSVDEVAGTVTWPNGADLDPEFSTATTSQSRAPARRFSPSGASSPPAEHRKNSHMRDRVMYVELKSGYNDDGPAWIGRVSFSKTGRSVYYRGRTLQRKPYGGGPGNHVDVETGEEFWVSGVKKDGSDRHWAGKGPVEIDEDARAEYESLTDKPRRTRRA